MDNELNTQYICAYHELKEEKLEAEKKSIIKHNPKDNSLNFSLKTIFLFFPSNILKKTFFIIKINN